MFRVRDSLFGKAILQCEDGDEWRDVRYQDSEMLRDGFHVLSHEKLESLQRRLDEAERVMREAAERRTAAGKKAWVTRLSKAA